MFFDNISDLPGIAARTSCSIFVVQHNFQNNIKNAIFLAPDDSKATRIISVEQIRDLIAQATNRETTDRFFIINPADAMNEAAQNAFLKTLEEPHPNCHFILITKNPHSLLPTIRSRAQIFYLRTKNRLDEPLAAKPKILESAKKLIATSPQNLPALAAELTKAKTNTREIILETIGAAIEMLYKSYFKTGNAKFLAKLPNFLALYDTISKNGHIKLHLIADLC